MGRRVNDRPQFDKACLRAYDAKQEAYRRWTRPRTNESFAKFPRKRAEAETTYDGALRAYYVMVQSKLVTVDGQRKWWEVLKGVFVLL